MLVSIKFLDFGLLPDSSLSGPAVYLSTPHIREFLPQMMCGKGFLLCISVKLGEHIRFFIMCMVWQLEKIRQFILCVIEESVEHPAHQRFLQLSVPAGLSVCMNI